jgi:predicted ATPase/DNA-binding SARP family transcriptional activator
MSNDLVRFQLLGPFGGSIGGRSIQLGGPKQRALLCYLVLHAGEPVSNATLIDAVWGDEAPDGAIRSVRTYVSNLRRLFGDAVRLRGEHGAYRIDRRSIETDVEDFRAAVKSAAETSNAAERSRMLREALDLWRGSVLVDVMHSWAQETAVVLEWERQRAIAAWAEATLETNDATEVIPLLEVTAADNPLDEHLSGLLMRALYRTGRHADALAVYRRLRDQLSRELGVQPGPELQGLEDQILLHEASLSGSEPSWLPAALTPLVGRRVEVEELDALLDRVRLLTLTGPGGVGKTRLVMELGRLAVSRHDQPVFFADLSTVSEGSAVDAVLAASARVQPHPDSGVLAGLIEYLRPRRALLIVDNCEHLAGTVARSLAALVRNCPQITVVATSRAPLHIDGELEWRTPSLPLPDRPDGPISVLRKWPAVELLVGRAPSSFRLTDANRSDVVELCRRLDGLPLALELAASRLGSMTPSEIISSLGSEVLIMRGADTDDVRHRTLDATVGWSYGLLPQECRRLMDQLGVMSGWFLFDDVLAVCTPEHHDPDAVRVLLSALVEQSLVMAETSATRTRYRLLETIRGFALARLGSSEPGLRRTHAEHFAQVAEVEAARLVTPEEGEAAVELSFAYDNLRSAVTWAIGEREIDLASRIVAAIPDWGYWRSRYELAIWAKWVWETTTPQDPRWRAVCGTAARGAWVSGHFDDAVRYGTSALGLDGVVIARCAYPEDAVADVALYRGDAQMALDHYEQVAASARQSGDVTREVWAMYYVAVTNAVLRRPIEANAAADQALLGARRSGNPTAIAFSLYARGLASKTMAPLEAIVMFEEAVRVAASVGNDWFGGVARMELASTRASHGDRNVGLKQLSEVIDHWHRVGDDTQLRLTWRYLVNALVRDGLPDEAAVLVGALVADSRSALSHPHPQVQDGLRDLLGGPEYTRHTVRGAVMTVGELVAASLAAIDRCLHPSQI